MHALAVHASGILCVGASLSGLWLTHTDGAIMLILPVLKEYRSIVGRVLWCCGVVFELVTAAF